jgi:hypothetical protein
MQNLRRGKRKGGGKEKKSIEAHLLLNRAHIRDH